MKALTIHQPWASAIALGLKRFETRAWAPPLDGFWLAIHAGKKKTDEARGLFESLAPQFAAAGTPESFDDLPFGCFVATAWVNEVHNTWHLTNHPGGRALLKQAALSETLELALGDFGHDRFAWRLKAVNRLRTPVPARGYQKLWNYHKQVAA